MPRGLSFTVKLEDDVRLSSFANEMWAQLFKQVVAVNAVIRKLVNRAVITFAMNQLR